jgi:hypothetical protein
MRSDLEQERAKTRTELSESALMAFSLSPEMLSTTRSYAIAKE